MMMLELSNIVLQYGRHPVLCDLSFRFRKGATTAITGPSGSGKSTLLYLAGLLLRPTSGRITFDSLDLTDLNDASAARFRRSNVGFVFQDSILDSRRSVLANASEGAILAGLPRELVRDRAVSMLQEVGVTVPLDRRPGQISGGQAQRVALCRAMIKQPPIILADEPTGNLDSKSSDLVMSALRRAAAEGATVAIATHDPQVVEMCDDAADVSRL